MCIRDSYTAIALLIGFVGFFSSRYAQKALQQSIGQQTATLASKIINDIDREIFSQIETIEEYSNDLFLHKALLTSNNIFSQMDNPEKYVIERNLEWLFYNEKDFNPFFQNILQNKISRNLINKIRFYEEEYSYPVIAEIIVANKYGATIGLTGMTEDYKQDDEKWFKIAKKDGFYIEDIAFDRSAGVFSTDFAIRIEDSDGNFLGVIKAVNNIKQPINIIEQTARTQKYKSFKCALATKEGKIIYSTCPFNFMESIPEHIAAHLKKTSKKYSGYFLCNDSPILSSNCLLYTSPSPRDLSTSRMPSSNKEDGKTLVAYARSRGFRDFKGFNWILLACYDTKEIFKPVTDFCNIMYVTTVFIIIIASLIDLIISRSIALPLKQLNKAFSEIGKGNMKPEINIRSKDEFGLLSKNLLKNGVGLLIRNQFLLVIIVMVYTKNMEKRSSAFPEDLSTR